MSQYPDNRRADAHRRGGGAEGAQYPATAPADAPVDPNAPLQSWGKWEQTRHYSLEVVQHPLRCRMAGFGDRDRRPLAPAVVAKMIVRNENSRILDVDDVEIDFFLVTCDLWSVDGGRELNLVQNPSTAARKKRPLEHPGSGHASADESSDPAQNPPSYGQGTSGTANPAPEGYSGSGAYARYPPQAGAYAQGAPQWQQPPYPAQAQTWEGTNPPTLPSITSLVPHSPSPSGTWDQASSGFSEGGAQQGYGSYPGQYGDNSPQRTGGSSTRNLPPSHSWSGGAGRYGDSYSDSAQTYDPRASSASAASSSAPPTLQPPPPRDAQSAQGSQTEFTRTLVGPLSANAARLKDDHSQFGIFFTFQDLSVRTEGTFRLRLRLMNVGANFARPQATNSTPQPQVHNAMSPVLALTWTEPFTVYSAKKFPGVPPITELSKAFASQGQKLPLRSRAGNRNRGRGASDDEEGSEAGSGDEA